MAMQPRSGSIWILTMCFYVLCLALAVSAAEREPSRHDAVHTIRDLSALTHYQEELRIWCGHAAPRTPVETCMEASLKRHGLPPTFFVEKRAALILQLGAQSAALSKQPASAVASLQVPDSGALDSPQGLCPFLGRLAVAIVADRDTREQYLSPARAFDQLLLRVLGTDTARANLRRLGREMIDELAFGTGRTLNADQAQHQTMTTCRQQARK
jgi:hypothetical protein